MKISLNLTLSEASELAVYCNMRKKIQPINRQQRVQLSIMQEVAVKTHRFYINFHDSKKTRKISFKIYEADMLEQYFANILNYVGDEYSKNVLRKIIGEINQQLA